MTPQIPLDLSPDPDYSFENFLLSETNRAAFNRLKSWPDAGFPILLITGPAGVGKTHLGEAWRRLAQEHIQYDPEDQAPLKKLADKNVWLDDAQAASEHTLFTLINMALNGEIRSLLLTANVAGSEWNIELPDLRSRISNLPLIQIEAHDDAVLEPFLRKLFDDRGREVDAEIIRYILTYYDRAADRLRSLVAEIDMLAASEKKDVTRVFVSRYLKTL